MVAFEKLTDSHRVLIAKVHCIFSFLTSKIGAKIVVKSIRKGLGKIGTFNFLGYWKICENEIAIFK